MKVILTLPDGTEITHECERVCACYRVDIPGEDGLGELHIVANEAGVIHDIYASRKSPLDHNLATCAETAQQIVERLTEDFTH